MFGDATEVASELRRQRIRVHRSRKTSQSVPVLAKSDRQALRLLISDHLQAMLGLPQKQIGGFEILARFAAYQFFVFQFGEHRERAGSAQTRPFAAEDQLLRLHEKFDFANAAAAQFEIVADDGDLGMAAHGVNLAFHCVNVGNRRIIKIAAPDERRELYEKSLAEPAVTGNRTRLDQSCAFPVLPDGFIIKEGGRQGDSDRGRAGIRAQSQIHAQDIAVGGALLQNFHQAPRHPHEKRRRLVHLRNGLARGIEQNDEIRVARIVQFPGAMLAEREKYDAAALIWRRCVRQVQFAACCRFTKDEVQGGRDEDVGAFGQRLHHGLGLPDATEIGERHEQRDLLLGAPQEAHEFGFRVGLRLRRDEIPKKFVQPQFRRRREQTNQSARIGRDQLPEIGRMVGNAQEQRPGAGRSRSS